MQRLPLVLGCPQQEAESLDEKPRVVHLCVWALGICVYGSGLGAVDLDRVCLDFTSKQEAKLQCGPLESKGFLHVPSMPAFKVFSAPVFQSQG